MSRSTVNLHRRNRAQAGSSCGQWKPKPDSMRAVLCPLACWSAGTWLSSPSPSRIDVRCPGVGAGRCWEDLSLLRHLPDIELSQQTVSDQWST